ncbi:nuclear transport factor 2 family protein [Pontivivens insulae]|uniref:SnoaL-like domain-containing protein n=1 Tax=Pontivivens insulae TaxID=1639689 RepID=A0A2R8AAI7_9RHOB|nr:ester cyclase [Pontivivens insulae]RED13142.1 SnoaL-like polyketide cyclase [Pontivivens insulae]SPF29234.1 hypothetical protein POI8812_01541 [Pontivivens insulae]
MNDLSALKSTWHDQLRDFFDGSGDLSVRAGAELRCSDPFSVDAGLPGLRATLAASLHGLERVAHVCAFGRSKFDPRQPQHREGRLLIATMGTYRGRFEKALFGIPATSAPVDLRFCDVHQIEDDQIVASWCLIDLLDLARQAGVYPLAPMLGASGPWPNPPMNGTNMTCDPGAGQAGFDTVMAMHEALLSFDGKSLDSMDHAAFWTEEFDWCGPAGIGTTRGLAEFRAHHQIPFLTGFPDRNGAGHYVRIGDGDVVVTGGWPSVVGTHQGEWLGLPPTGKRIEMRVMDFYRLDGGRIAQNWVPIDIPHMLSQMGVDVWARIRHLAGDPRRTL